MRKLLNKNENVVQDMMAGIIRVHSKYLIKYVKQGIIAKKEINKEKVSLISGGGSGHEPTHAGYIGVGMLDVAICGEIFTSPTPDMIQKAIKIGRTNKGTLLVVKNYTGDVMNFEVAKTLAEAEGNNNIEMVIVNDDVAVKDSLYTTGRRGIAGTLFVHKIAGAAANRGDELFQVKAIAKKVISNTRSMGMSLGHCIVPSSGKASFELKDGDIEIGLGIHGEPGIRQEKNKGAKVVVRTLIKKILDDLDYTNSKVGFMINGLGGTPLMELFIANNEAWKYLEEKKINIVFNKVGNFMTSLEMPGMSISLIKLDDELEELINMETNAPGWK